MNAMLNQAREIFIEAVGKIPAERWEAFLSARCGDDAELHRHVQQLLQAHSEAGSFLEQPAIGTQPSAMAEGPGTVIGPYKLLQQIGEGGMGTVFMAEQTQPVQRKVALKLIKSGMDSRQVIARFEAERQALAMMDHPNIARVFEAGTTAGEPGGVSPGRPYFVMELVKGVPITRYCDEHHLTPRQRLELFVPVCHAVQHAHQKGIIHRDLKPTNVLVCLYDGKPVPKVIDFGVAKATGAPLTERTLFTEFGQVVGTLEYMSPEQAELNQLDIDTRSDIYALGVLLYELLTGTTPLERRCFQSAAFLEVLRLIREEEPQKPSTRLSTTAGLPAIAVNRGLEPKKLTGLVRGEIDWIVMKSLEKDRNRRYETANAFALDLQRYLAEEPVQACPPSARYRLRKFARKNRKLLATAVAFFFLLLVGAAISAWQAVRATGAESLALANEHQALAERDATEQARRDEAEQRRQAIEQRNRAVAEQQRANDAAAVALAVNDFLEKDLLGQADIGNQEPGAERNRNISVRELLDRAAREIDAKFKGQERTEAAIRLTLGRAYRALAEYPAAQQHLERSLALRRQQLGADHLDTLEAMHALGLVHLDCERYDEAESLVKQALAGFRTQLGANHRDTLTALQDLAAVYQALGRHKEAEPLFDEALKGLRVKLGFDHFNTLTTMHNLASTQMALGRYDEAERGYKAVLEFRRVKLGDDHPHTLGSIHDLAGLQRTRGRYVEAERLYKQVIELRQAKLGADHPDTLESMNGLALVLRDRGRYDQAEPLYRQVLDARRAKLGAGHTATLNSMNNLAALYRDLSRFEEAEPLFQQVREGWRAKLGADHPQTLISTNNLATLYLSQRRYAEAEPLLKQVQEGFRAELGADHPNTLQSTYNLAGLYMELARYDDAEPLFQQVFEARRAKQGADHPATLASLNSLALVHNARGVYDKAEPLFQQVLEARRAKLGADHPDTIRSMNNLALLYQEGRRYDEAAPLFEEAVTQAKKRLGLGHRETQRYLLNQADLYSKEGKPELAEPELRELAAFIRDKFGPDSLAHGGQLGRLAQNLLEQKKYTEAESSARDSLAILAKKEPDAWTTFRAQSLLGGALLGQKKYAEAEPFLLQGTAGMRERAAKVPKESRSHLTQAGERLVQLYDAWGQPEKAAEWRKKLAAEKPN